MGCQMWAMLRGDIPGNPYGKYFACPIQTQTLQGLWLTGFTPEVVLPSPAVDTLINSITSTKEICISPINHSLWPNSEGMWGIKIVLRNTLTLSAPANAVLALRDTNCSWTILNYLIQLFTCILFVDVSVPLEISIIFNKTISITRYVHTIIWTNFYSNKEP